MIKRIGRDTYTIKYKKQNMILTSDDVKTIESEMSDLGL